MLEQQVALGFMDTLGAAGGNALLQIFGGSENFFKADAALCSEMGCGKKFCDELDTLRQRALENAVKEIEICRKRGIWILTREDPAYPQALAMCNDAPLVLYGYGNKNINYKRAVAVVGTRHASVYGKNQARKLVQELRGYADCIVSGLALGIDTEAHKSALDYRLRTVAVMGPGLDNIYPPSNKKLAEQILQDGGSIISEMPWKTPPIAGLFPRRNRIIAGLAQATILVEGALQSGGVITARAADSYQRIVGAVPGRNDMYYQSGCNALIAARVAQLVCSAQDITRALGWESDTGPALEPQDNGTERRPGDLTQAHILSILKIENPAPYDLLLLKCNLEPKDLSAVLLKMEIAGLVRALPGNFYTKC